VHVGRDRALGGLRFFPGARPSQHSRGEAQRAGHPSVRGGAIRVETEGREGLHWVASIGLCPIFRQRLPEGPKFIAEWVADLIEGPMPFQNLLGKHACPKP